MIYFSIKKVQRMFICKCMYILCIYMYILYMKCMVSILIQGRKSFVFNFSMAPLKSEMFPKYKIVYMISLILLLYYLGSLISLDFSYTSQPTQFRISKPGLEHLCGSSKFPIKIWGKSVQGSWVMLWVMLCYVFFIQVNPLNLEFQNQAQNKFEANRSRVHELCYAT